MTCGIGIDYGTLSVRAVVVHLKSGEILGEKVCAYKHGVIDNTLPDGTALTEKGWMLANPNDYWNSLAIAVKGALQNAAISSSNIKTLAIAATACTLMPVDANLVPLCNLAQFQNRPHSYAKLWKHHRAQPYADLMTDTAKKINPALLDDYGGKISSEWAIPKVLEVLKEDPEIYSHADRFMQFSDWITARLVGNHNVQNASIALYKNMWNKEKGYPCDSYLNAVDERAHEIVYQKLRGHKIMAGEKAGVLTQEHAEYLGLTPGITVGMAHTDAHAAAYGAGIYQHGEYAFIIGTSSCGHLISKNHTIVPGVTGAIKNGLIENLTCYSAGQACVGDMLDWYISNCLPPHYYEKAQQANQSIHLFLEEKAALQKPGDCHLVALDWWNGNRSILTNGNLTGTLVGLTMSTTPQDIYRALLDAIAFGHKEIIDNFYAHNLQIERMIFCGGIAGKNNLLMQIMADVLNRPIHVSTQLQASALGAAMCAAAALGKEQGGYSSLIEAIEQMKGSIMKTYLPIKENVALYHNLFSIYHSLHQWFGTINPLLMAKLKTPNSI